MENSITNLVLLDFAGEPRASTEAIAKGYKVSHRSVLQLLRKYLPRLETMGRVAFEMRTFQTKGGLQSKEYALLNVRQASFFVSLMRNTEEVVDFKLNLSNAFHDMATSLGHRDMTVWERRIKFEAKAQTSATLGSIGSKMMSTRKKEKKPLDHERLLLDAEMQPGLLFS